MTWLHGIISRAGAVQADVDAKQFALRVSGRPQELGTRGAYSAAFTTGILPAALAANSEIFQLRWAHSTFLILLRSVKVSAAVSTTAFVAGVPPRLELYNAHGWTVQGTGGTGITFLTDDAKKRIGFPQSAFAAGDIRIATTAALGVGTKTLEGMAARAIIGNTGGATVTTQVFPPGTILWMRDTAEEYPYIYGQNDGFVIRSAEVPGTGTWKCCVEVEWAEVDPAQVSGWP